MMKVELICFGNELLIGKTVNTNAHWLGRQITSLGGEVVRITTGHDEKKQMVEILREAITRQPDIIITTGGLGPTFDDMTLQAVAEAVNSELELNEQAFQMIQERLEYLKDEKGIEIELTEEREQMAMLPKNAQPLKNHAGSAPGVFIEYNNIKLFSLPGVPREMKSIFTEEVMDIFPKSEDLQYYEEQFLVRHVPESELAAAIAPIRKKHPTVYIKTHPKTPSTSKKGFIQVEIHITSLCLEKDKKHVSKATKEIRSKISNLRGVTGEKPKILPVNT
ncbi:MAG: molybdopterin-binding protein [Asgard group archaeon]|nr:molybdopterin-binding protein [Asgard group archaeon]